MVVEGIEDEKVSKASIVREYLSSHPDASTRGASAALIKERPDVFKNFESARMHVRMARGEAGERCRKRYSAVSGHYYTVEALEKLYNVPQPVEVKEWRPYLLPLAIEKMLILADVHIPFHDREALMRAIDDGVKQGCDTALLNGDFLDCHMESRFRKEAPPKMRFLDELETAKDVLKILCKSFKKVVYKTGNHEDRHEHYLHDHAEVFYELPQFRLSALLDLAHNGIIEVESKRVVRFGKLNILHGHEYKGGMTSPVNPARGLFLRTKAVSLCSHFHQQSEHSEPTLDGVTIAAWSTGCLCQLHPEYMPYNKWTTGYAIVERVSDTGNFIVLQRKIINGRVY